jgi:heme-degrading monooxygenase HmoA
MRVRAGGEDAFEEAWRGIALAASRWPGNLRQDLLRDAADPRQYVATSDWSSREAFRAFETSPRQDVLTAPLRALREAVQMSVDDLLNHVEGEGAATKDAATKDAATKDAGGREAGGRRAGGRESGRQEAGRQAGGGENEVRA